MDQAHRNGKLAIGGVLGHPFQGRDSNAAAHENGGPGFIKDVVAERSLHEDSVARLQRVEGALELGA